MADMKTTIIRAMEHGSETLETVRILRENGIDYTFTPEETTKKICSLHSNLILKVSEAYMNTDNSRTIRFVGVNGELPVFESGQYINIFLTIGGVRTSRPYSISSPSNQRGYYEITVARISENGFVSDYLIDELRVGDIVEANGPAGNFKYNPVFHKKDVVLIAGGSGITPFISMIKEVLERGLDRNIFLIYGVPNTYNVIYIDEIEKMAKEYENFEYELVCSDPDKDWKGLTGFITKDIINHLVGDTNNKTYYICGPQAMNLSVENSLVELGVKKSMIRREMFAQNQGVYLMPGWPKNVDPDHEFNINVISEELDVLIKGKAGESLLTSLERNHIRMNVCCRSGECSLCRVQLVDGDVYLVRGSLQRRADEKFGYIHSCKAYPISDVTILI